MCSCVVLEIQTGTWECFLPLGRDLRSCCPAQPGAMWDWQGSSSTVSQPSKSHLSCTLEFPDFCMMSPSVTLLIVLLLPFLIFASGVTNGWLSQWCRSVCDVGTGRWADNGRNWIVVTWGGDAAQEAVACCSPGVSSEINASEKPPWQRDRCLCHSRGCFLCF